MKKNSFIIDKYGAISLLLFLAFYIFWLGLKALFDSSILVHDSIIILIGWIGIIVLFFILITYKKSRGSFLSLYTIFVLLSYLFNFGQCIMWSFGIHANDDITNSLLYGFYTPSNKLILEAQLFFLVCILAIHASVMFFRVPSKNNNSVSLLNEKQKQTIKRAIFCVSITFSFIVIPLTFINLFNIFRTASTEGYYYLYYGQDQRTTIFILQECFFTCLIGILIGSSFNKKAMVFVYLIFAFYLALNLAIGERGEWLYKLLILVWIYHRFYKKIKIKTFVVLFLIGFLSLYLIRAIVAIRDYGVTYEAIKDALFSNNSNPLFESIFEMGGTMSVNIFVINSNVAYQYGNSYFLSILAMPTMKIPAALGIDYVPISQWFSSDILKINYGAAFSMYAEAYLNFGYIFAPTFLLLMGGLVKCITNVFKKMPTDNPLLALFKISTTLYLFSMIRNTFHDFAKYWFLGCLPIIILSYFAIKYFGAKND